MNIFGSLRKLLFKPLFVNPTKTDQRLAVAGTSVLRGIPSTTRTLVKDTLQIQRGQTTSSASKPISAIQQIKALLPEEVFTAIETLPLLKDVELNYIADGSSSEQQLQRLGKLKKALLEPSVNNIDSLLENPNSPTLAEQALKHQIIERFDAEVYSLQDRIRRLDFAQSEQGIDQNYGWLMGINTETYTAEIASGSERAKSIIPVLREFLEKDRQLLSGDAPYSQTQFNYPPSCLSDPLRNVYSHPLRAPDTRSSKRIRFSALLARKVKLEGLLENITKIPNA